MQLIDHLVCLFVCLIALHAKQPMKMLAPWQRLYVIVQSIVSSR